MSVSALEHTRRVGVTRSCCVAFALLVLTSGCSILPHKEVFCGYGHVEEDGGGFFYERDGGGFFYEKDGGGFFYERDGVNPRYQAICRPGVPPPP